MLFKSKIVALKIEGDLVQIASKDLNLSFNYSSINYLYINNETDETAREIEVSVKKLRQTEPEKENQLFIKLSVNGISFGFTTIRSQGEILARKVEEETRKLLLSARPAPGSILDEIIQKELVEESENLEYPIYFHAGNRFGEENGNDFEKDVLGGI